MEPLINRYRNITVLLLVILAQMVLLAVQVKNDQDVRMIRVWSVTAVTPLARALEGVRSGTFGIFKNYILLRDVHEENRRLRDDLDRLKIENLFLRTELSAADRAKALAQFQERTPSRTLAARVIGTGAGVNSKTVFLDRGSVAGVQRGMAVVTPDGIVGKVIAAYPTASEVLLVTDPDFAAGVVSQKHHVQGTLKGEGHANCKVDYVPHEEKVEPGEMFYTSGYDRVFPKGFPAGMVRVVRPGPQFQEIVVEPVGLRRGLEEVLILTEGVHQAIPDAPPERTPVYMMPAPEAPPAPVAGTAPAAPPSGTDADRLLQRYKAVGDAQGHKFGEGLPGSRPPDFNLPVATSSPAAPGAQSAPGGAAPAGAAPGTSARPPGSSPPAPAPAPVPAPGAPQPRTAPSQAARPPAQRPDSGAAAAPPRGAGSPAQPGTSPGSAGAPAARPVPKPEPETPAPRKESPAPAGAPKPAPANTAAPPAASRFVPAGPAALLTNGPAIGAPGLVAGGSAAPAGPSVPPACELL